MKIKVEFSKVIYQGDSFEKLHWGPVQFPKFYTLTDGRLGIFIHNDDDAPHALGNGIYMVSADNGKTFTYATEKDLEKFADVILSDGSGLKVISDKTKSITEYKVGENLFGSYRIPSDTCHSFPPKDDGTLPSPFTIASDIFGSRDSVYYVDDLPKEIIDKDFKFSKRNENENKTEVISSPVEWNYRTVNLYNPNVVYGTGKDEILLSFVGLTGGACMRKAPNGDLWIAEYRHHSASPQSGAYYGKSSIFFFKSTDEGKSWKCISHIPYLPDESYEKNDIYAYMRGGFFEPTLEIYKDGSMMCILRTCDVFNGTPEWGPTYITYSYDNGSTWTKPVYFKEKGALPVSVQLDCGVTLAVITRPGIDVYASNDNAKTFPEKIEIMTANDRSSLSESKPERPNFWMWAGSCCNCSIIATGKNTALLAYSDFYVNDDSGKPRKSIIVTSLTVEL